MIDTKGIKIKQKLIAGVLNAKLPELVNWGVQKIYTGANENLRGLKIPVRANREDFPVIGTMPIPQRTTMLRHSLKIKMFNKFFKAVYSDPAIAPYNKFVHDGTKKMKPRRFLADVYNKNRLGIASHWNSEIRKEIRRVSA